MQLLPSKKPIKWRFIILMAIFFVILLSLPVAYLYFENQYSGRIYPGVKLGNLDLSGKNRLEAKTLINQKIDILKDKGVDIVFHKHRETLYPLVSTFDADIAYEIISFDTEKTLDSLFSFGRKGRLTEQIEQKYKALQKGAIFRLEVNLNDEKIDEFLHDDFADFSRPAENAKLVYNEATWERVAFFSVEEEKYGELIEYKKGIEKMRKNLSLLNFSDIELQAAVNYPKILKKDCLNIDAKANKLLSEAPFYLAYEKMTWPISARQMREWLTLKTKVGNTKDKHFVALDFEKVEKYLLQGIAPEVNIEPVDAKFEIKDGRVEEFQVSQDGKKIDIIKTFGEIEKKLLAGLDEEEKIEMVVVEQKSELQTSDINDMGITEIIGTGHSDFSGSPKNRRHNIAVGADAVNGTLIKPGEEFSLLKTLGDIDKEAGYLPELVIKDNKTVPEYGGGLCQIGTTVFRATLASGMPVTQRRNHSYRVSYYEPAGTDATIYDPWPDYRFLNDSKYSILIESRIEGDDLYFDFWSTEDGREATTTYPTIHKIVRPAPTKIIETLELEPGQRKCTEHAHNGADAFFDYTVKYEKNNLPEDIEEKIAELEEDEEVLDEMYVKEKRFYSHYVPWREVCLVGVEELSTSTEEKL